LTALTPGMASAAPRAASRWRASRTCPPTARLLHFERSRRSCPAESTFEVPTLRAPGCESRRSAVRVRFRRLQRPARQAAVDAALAHLRHIAPDTARLCPGNSFAALDGHNRGNNKRCPAARRRQLREGRIRHPYPFRSHGAGDLAEADGVDDLLRTQRRADARLQPV